jgi:hypothetical protein
VPATTVPATTVPPTTVPPTTVPPTTVPPTTVVLAPGPRVQVADATGSFVVLLPAAFQTNVQPITLDGVEMQQVSGATDIERYLSGDFAVLGATVLTAPVSPTLTADSLLAQFEPGDACTLSGVERKVRTAKGAATVISYDDCGDGQDAMVLIGVQTSTPPQVVLVGLQAPEPARGGARALAISILESLRQA